MHSFVSLFCFLKGVNQPIKKKKGKQTPAYVFASIAAT